MTKEELMQDDEIHEAFLNLKQTIIDGIPIWMHVMRKEHVPGISLYVGNKKDHKIYFLYKKLTEMDAEFEENLKSLIEKIMEKQ